MTKYEMTMTRISDLSEVTFRFDEIISIKPPELEAIYILITSHKLSGSNYIQGFQPVNVFIYKKREKNTSSEKSLTKRQRPKFWTWKIENIVAN